MSDANVPDKGRAAGPDGLPALGEIIRTFDLAARKSLGQNFILDLNLTRKIARSAGPLGESTVIEVGPGPGGLTRALLLEGAGHVIAIETDARCLPALELIRERYPGRLDIVPADALEVDWPSLVAGRGRVIIVANLPYNIATRLLIQWLETEPWPPWWSQMALMFQKEVAERIVAEPDTKAYGRLAVIAQWRCRPRIALRLGPEAFSPPPKVASAVVLFEPKAACEPHCSVTTLGRVTGAAFGQRRKMLRQSLRLLGRDTSALLAATGIDPERRAENLSPEEFARIACAIDEGVGQSISF
jgi:16S rRNA (adenine1518-N6/adenine1519-N6)-dimethyltransferase